jgi:hypothetical protein
VFCNINRTVFLDKDRTMDEVQKHNIRTNVPSSQIFRSYVQHRIIQYFLSTSLRVWALLKFLLITQTSTEMSYVSGYLLTFNRYSFILLVRLVTLLLKFLLITQASTEMSYVSGYVLTSTDIVLFYLFGS